MYDISLLATLFLLRILFSGTNSSKFPGVYYFPFPKNKSKAAAVIA